MDELSQSYKDSRNRDFLYGIIDIGEVIDMPMMYRISPIPESKIPTAVAPVFQHLVDIYSSETNKVLSVWREFSNEDLSFRPHSRSSTVQEQMRHQMLSERRFFGEFLGFPESDPSKILPSEPTVNGFVEKMEEFALRRLGTIAAKDEKWWMETVRFFDVDRQRIWIFWRRVLHTAHHRAQLALYLRMLNKPVPPVYGPTADATWIGADPTHTEDAARRA
jgi:uncharacterized damage-inducible protein DinB